jgi:hypothetical protein
LSFCSINLHFAGDAALKALKQQHATSTKKSKTAARFAIFRPDAETNVLASTTASNDNEA